VASGLSRAHNHALALEKNLSKHKDAILAQKGLETGKV
jgi:hypothetical protein